jgi:hypothetical protein
VETSGERRFIVGQEFGGELSEEIREVGTSTWAKVGGGETSEHPETRPLSPFRVAIYRPWQGSMDEGWLRWILEHYQFPLTELRNDRVLAGGLEEDFDAIVIPSVGVSAILNGNREGSVPPEYVGGIGEEGVEALKAFARAGGTILFHDGSCDLALQALDLPLQEVSRAARDAGFYSAGSILRFDWSQGSDLTRGMDPDGVAFMSSGAMLFEVTGPGQGDVGPPQVIGAFPGEGPLLLSGYLEGEEGLFGKASVIEVPFGEGRLVLVGFSLHNRAQTVANFKLLFNAVASG